MYFIYDQNNNKLNHDTTALVGFITKIEAEYYLKEFIRLYDTEGDTFTIEVIN